MCAVMSLGGDTGNGILERSEREATLHYKTCEDANNARIKEELVMQDGTGDEEVLSANDSETDERLGDQEGETDGIGIDEQNLGTDGEKSPEGLLGYKCKRVLKHDYPLNSLEPLPEGWVTTSHSSGFPIYFHKKSRVVTWSRPYSLLTGYLAKHKIPLQSIPCLHYVKKKTNSGKQVEQSDISSTDDGERRLNTEGSNDKRSDVESSPHGADSTIPQPKVTLHEQKDLCIGDDELKKYLERLFTFETLKIPQFKKWSQRRDFNRNIKRKKLEETQNVSQESGKNVESTAGPVITLTVEQEDGASGSTRNRKFILNTKGKPMICILHEYAQRVLRVQPNYVFGIREDAAEPFEASIKLNDKVYGTAVAINKKSAKNKAALATLEMLIPGFKGQVESSQGSPDMDCFNEVSVTDSRVHELCVHTGQLLPYHLLTECLKRHQGVADTNVSYDVQQGKRRSLNYTMICGKHVVTGVAKNKKIGKQLAAQQILQRLHPEVKTWAELIKLYGTSLAQERARRKQEEQEIFDLKQRKNLNEDDDSDGGRNNKQTGEDKPSMEPNPELLAKLREMMLKLQAGVKETDGAPPSKKCKPTPMAAAVLAGKGLLKNSTKDDTRDVADAAEFETVVASS